MIKTAVILTVYNRREVTLQGFRTLYRAIGFLQKEQPDIDYKFDIYMTDDGCTDGTGEAVRKEFPDVHIIQGDGTLYWSGGMRKAWQTAIDSGIEYVFYLWFNDDANLYENALVTLFNSEKKAKGDAIISGAFCDSKGVVSYGGKGKNGDLMSPNSKIQTIYQLNGNFVLIPKKVFTSIGKISKTYKHGYGDYDYGYRAQKAGFKVLLSPFFVGVTERHDVKEPKHFLDGMTFRNRWKGLHSAQYSPEVAFLFNLRYNGILFAVKSYITSYIFTISPWIYKHRNIL